jgi:hypothetical protein
MKHFTLHFIILCALSLCIPVDANAQFKIDAQLRDRFEFRDGYQKILPSTAQPAYLISQRTRLSFYYETDNLKVKITPQDVRFWGDEQIASSTGVFGDQASLELFEGYAEFRAASNTWISIGRQQLVYDNERMLATRNWNQQGIAYDAVVLKFRFGEWNLHAAGSWNTLVELSSENLYDADRIKSLNFIWLNRKFSESFQASLMHIASGVTETDTTNTINFRQTTGIYAAYKKDNLKLWSDLHYQYGENRAGTPVSAILAGADASYRIGKFTPGVGFEYLSGNSKAGSELTTDNLFDILYGARHRYLGLMDYFRNIPQHTSGGGIADYYFYLNLEISKKINIVNTGHYFRLAQLNPTTPGDRNLGFENDLILKYKFSDWGQLEGGYLFLLPTESLKTIQNIPDDRFAEFAYLQLTLTPVLFVQKNQQ